MAHGISLHSLNRVDPAHYDGWDGILAGSESDARDMSELAKSRGFESNVFLTEQATAGAVTTAVERIASELSTGDLFLLSFSGAVVKCQTETTLAITR